MTLKVSNLALVRIYERKRKINNQFTGIYMKSNDIQVHVKGKGKAVPLQAWKGPEDSRKLRSPDFVTTAQDGVRLSALRN